MLIDFDSENCFVFGIFFSCLLIGLIIFGRKPYVLYKTVNTEVCLFMFKNECDFPWVRTFVWGFVFI